VSGETRITDLLWQGRAGDKSAQDRLADAVYSELRRLARGFLRREHAADTLQPTALANEAYLRLVAQDLPDLQSRGQFYALVAHRMRQILVDHARAKLAAKRGAGAKAVSLDENLDAAAEIDTDVLALNDALDALLAIDERKHKILELRYFAGLSIEETAEALGISVATVGREQRLGQAWLKRELSKR
jgi:RNA polymerase sigma factor (TIGR02999 family)